MKTETLNKRIVVDYKVEKSIQQLKRAEKLAWIFFIGIGIVYIAASLIIGF